MTDRARSKAGLLLVLSLLAYAPAIVDGGFVWDDDQYVTDNPTLRSAEGLRAIWTDTFATPQFYPLTHTTFWLEYRLWGLQPAGYHAVNVVLHTASAILLMVLLGRLGIAGGFLAAMIFALHPINVESAAWITERKNVLSCFFYLASLLCWVRVFRIGDMAEDPGGGPRRLFPAFAGLVLFAAALLSKTVTSSLPITLAILLWWSGIRPNRRHVVYLGSMLVAGALMSVVTAWVERYDVGALGAEWAYTPLERVAIAGRAWWFYLGKLVWPFDLSFIYEKWRIEFGVATMAWPAAMLATLALCWMLRGRIGRGPLAAALHYTVALLPALGFFNVYPMRYSFVADHFAYLALLGPIALAAAAVYTLRIRSPRALSVAAFCGIVLVLGVSTFHRTRIYESRTSLWRDTVARNPTAWIAHNNLGALTADAGDLDSAERHFRTVLELKPDHSEARNNLGVVLLRHGRAHEAATLLREAAVLAPADVNTRVHLGDALLAIGDMAGAEAAYVAARIRAPADVRALGGLAKLYLAQSRFDRAVIHLERLAQLLPDDPVVCANLAATFATLGRHDEAEIRFRERLAMGPDDADVRYNFGNLLASIGRYTEAEEHYAAALRLRPGFDAARQRLEHLRTNF